MVDRRQSYWEIESGFYQQLRLYRHWYTSLEWSALKNSYAEIANRRMEAVVAASEVLNEINKR